MIFISVPVGWTDWMVKIKRRARLHVGRHMDNRDTLLASTSLFVFLSTPTMKVTKVINEVSGSDNSNMLPQANLNFYY